MSTEKPPVCISPRRARDSGLASVSAAPTDGAATMLDSQTLLQGRGSVDIRHHGLVYRLQATKLGKLILTK
jgi:hemin uptake protein HemP